MITVTEFAAKIGISTVYVRRMIAEGRLDAIKVGGRYAINDDANISPAKRPRGRPKRNHQ